MTVDYHDTVDGSNWNGSRVVTVLASNVNKLKLIWLLQWFLQQKFSKTVAYRNGADTELRATEDYLVYFKLAVGTELQVLSVPKG